MQNEIFKRKKKLQKENNGVIAKGDAHASCGHEAYSQQSHTKPAKKTSSKMLFR